MKQVAENLFRRGKSGSFYCRKRIPKTRLPAFPNGKGEFCVALQTRDLHEAKRRLHIELIKIDAQLAWAKNRLTEQRLKNTSHAIRSLADEQVVTLAESDPASFSRTAAHAAKHVDS